MSLEGPRIRRENKTIKAMIRLYCRANHGTDEGLCSGCEELRSYAEKRLDKCPYQEGKTTCLKCPTHCYKKDMRERIRVVMRYSGPRMVLRHPILALFHLIDGRRDAPL